MSLFGDEVEKIVEFDPLTGRETDELKFVKIYANSHYVTPRPTLIQAMNSIKAELKWRLEQLHQCRAPAGSAAARAAHALRPRNDGGDRHLRRHRELFALSHRPQARRAAADAVRICAGQRARVRATKAMSPFRRSAACIRGDFRRKATLAEYGFRLPSCMDNRPLRFEEWDVMRPQTVAVSATPSSLGARAGRRRVRRAGDPPDRPDRSAGRHPPRAHAGRRSGRRSARHRR